jgi:hypothetical protein
MRMMCSLYRNEYRYFKLAGATMGSRLGRSEEAGRGESPGVLIHICLGKTQDPPCIATYLKLAKCRVSCFISYVFSSTKSKNRRVKQVLLEGAGTKLY